MSRTAHHVRYDHWNIRIPDWSWRYDPPYWTRAGKHGRERNPQAQYRLVQDEEIVGNVVYDLRYHSGCKRVPKLLAHRTPDWGGWPYSWGHGGWRGWKQWANQLEGMARASARDYTREAAKVYRAGGDIDELPEPEGRHRHSARWEAW